MRLDLKIGLLETFGTQIVASRRLKITEGRLSHFVRGHDVPNKHERKILAKALGRDYFAEEEEPRADERRGVMGILADQRGSVGDYADTPKKSTPEKS